MEINKTSEKVLVWMHRQNITQMQLSVKLGCARQSLASKIDNNYFTPGDILKLKTLGCPL